MYVHRVHTSNSTTHHAQASIAPATARAGAIEAMRAVVSFLFFLFASSSSIRRRRPQQQHHHLIMAPSLLLDILTSLDIGACVLAFLNAAVLTAVTSVNAALHALLNDNSARAVWSELLLAQRPHLAPFLLMPGGKAAKALYHQRMGLNGRPPSPASDEHERTRLKERLGSVSMHVELRDIDNDRVLGTCAVPLWEEAKASAFFEDGVEIHLQWKVVHSEVALGIVDLGAKSSLRTFSRGLGPWDLGRELLGITPPEDLPCRIPICDRSIRHSFQQCRLRDPLLPRCTQLCWEGGGRWTSGGCWR